MGFGVRFSLSLCHKVSDGLQQWDDRYKIFTLSEENVSDKFPSKTHYDSGVSWVNVVGSKHSSPQQARV